MRVGEWEMLVEVYKLSARVERVYEELGSPGILVAVATFQTVLSSDLGSQGERETMYSQLLKWGRLSHNVV